MSWLTVIERGFVGIVGSPEIWRTACPAWRFRIDHLVLADLDQEGQDVRLADGSWREFGRRPTTTRFSLPGEIFADFDETGAAATNDYAALVANADTLRTALRTGKATGTGKQPMLVRLDGADYADFRIQVLGLRVNLDDVHATFTTAIIEVEVGEEGEPV